MEQTISPDTCYTGISVVPIIIVEAGYMISWHTSSTVINAYKFNLWGLREIFVVKTDHAADEVIYNETFKSNIQLTL